VPRTQHLALQGSDVSSTSTATSAAQPGTGPPGNVRKKRVTRRVGYARDADEVDEPGPRAKPQPAAPGQSKICSRLSAYILGPCPTIFYYYSKASAALQAAARSVGMAGDLSPASVKLGRLGSCEQPISAAVEPWWQRLTHCCLCSHQCTGLASAEQASCSCRRSAPGKLALRHQPGPFERI
jgi:hypothetical protein